MRAPATLVVLTILAAPARGQEPGERRPVFPAGVELVTVDVVVVGREGAPVRGLHAEDFTLEEDGRPQTLTAFEAVDRPPAAAAPTGAEPAPLPPVSTNRGASSGAARAFVIVFDDLHLDVAEAQRAREAVAGFLESAFTAGDRVTLVATSGGTLWHARLPEGGEALRSILPRLRGHARPPDSNTEWMTDYEATRIYRDRDPLVGGYVARRWQAAATDVLSFREDTVPDRVEVAAARICLEAERRNQETLDVLGRAFASLGAVRGRKTVLLVSGGLVHDPRLVEFRRAVVESHRANAALYFVDARGLVALGPGFTAEAAAPTELQDTSLALGALRVAAEGSESLAAETGGFSIRNRNDLGAGVREILRESSSYYLLGYVPSDGRRRLQFRRIEVSVAREGVRVRARRGYYPAAAGTAPREGRDAAFQRALDSPFDLDGIPLRATALVFAEKAPGKVQVLITAEVDIRALAFRDAGGVAEGTLEYRLEVADRETGALHRRDERIALELPPAVRERYSRSWFPVTREVTLAPGRYQARVVAREAATGRVGSLSHDFEVPTAEGLRLSTLVLSDRLREPPGVGPEFIARRTFPPSGDLHCRFEVYGAARDATTGRPAVRAGFAVRFADGRFLAASGATPMTPGPDEALGRTLGFPLTDAPPGRYELILVVEDEVSGRRVEAREAFTVGDPDAFERE